MTRDRMPNPSGDEAQDESPQDIEETTEQVDPADRDATMRASEARSDMEAGSADDEAAVTPGTTEEEPGTAAVEELVDSPTGAFSEMAHGEDEEHVAPDEAERDRITVAPADELEDAGSPGLTDESEAADPAATMSTGDETVQEELDSVLDDQSEPVDDVETDIHEEPVRSEEPAGVADDAVAQPVFAARSARLAAVSEASGPTTCPVCHNRTPANRFCSYCGTPLTERRSEQAPEAANPVQRVLGQARAMLHLDRPWSLGGVDASIIGAGLVLILLAALANSGGLVLFIASMILPLLVVWKLMERDIHESEPLLIILGLGAAGVLGGLILRWGAAWLTSSQWFETGRLNFGALGFGGPFAQQAGGAPFPVWFVNGILLPAVTIAAIVAGGIALRRWQQFRNEVMVGMTLAGAVAAGFSLGAVFVFVTPMIAMPGPQMSVSDWALLTIGTTVLHPLAITMAGAVLGAGVWRFMLNSELSRLILPAAGGVGGLLLLTLGSILLQSAGMWVEFIWVLLITIGVAVIFQMVLSAAVSHDRAILGNDRRRVICPHCRRITPAGTYCAHCGTELPADEELRDAAPA